MSSLNAAAPVRLTHAAVFLWRDDVHRKHCPSRCCIRLKDPAAAV